MTAVKTTTTAIKFNNIGFIDDISILAETPDGMQTLLDVHNMVWPGDQRSKIFLARD